MKLKIGKKTGLKYFDIEDVRSWGPCYDPIKFLKEGERYNAVKILEREDIPFADRLWVVLRIDLVSEKLMRLFAVWCVRQVVKSDADPRTLNALLVAERFANGEATKEELSAARSAAWAAAEPASWSAEAAAWAAEPALRSAAEYAARSAAESAAEAAARSTARSAEAAAESAAEAAARSTARSAARFALWSAQCKKLIEMVKTEGLQRKESKDE